eukprot:CAMPEP_0176302916 /NCGR_PEP_ID=MMETSP0121_2-20121125/61635_1 /TAXON_ID=160619 /ORGANISM="Kryptoperidinium foliaceum, Strain CCMP 1326" /LENGTH=61 /DNA_ID=CAMNT_0017644453 /DNA_START=20 /DNA_END=201 /DNA_ORIENTATION=+
MKRAAALAALCGAAMGVNLRQSRGTGQLLEASVAAESELTASQVLADKMDVSSALRHAHSR